MGRRYALAAALAAWVIWRVWASLRGSRYQPMPRARVRRLLELAGVTESDVVYDLGSGDGRIVRSAARDFGARAVGVEVDPLRWSIARLGSRMRHERGVTWIRGDLFDTDLAEATVVVAFLRPKTNIALESKLRRELTGGSRVAAYVHEFPGLELIAEDSSARVRIYRIGT